MKVVIKPTQKAQRVVSCHTCAFAVDCWKRVLGFCSGYWRKSAREPGLPRSSERLR